MVNAMQNFIITFDDLVSVHGDKLATEFLVTLENLSGIFDTKTADKNSRYQQALNALHDIDFSMIDENLGGLQ